MLNPNIYKSQAEYWKNLPIIDRSIKACVHLEDEEDIFFWDTILQKCDAGKYLYIPYSKSKEGHDTHGCEQCLKFLPFLSDTFFICIDSDYRYLLQQPNIDAKHYVLQTYTYSWENHLCEKSSLEANCKTVGLISDFDFTSFLSELSHILYKPLLILLHSKQHDDKEITDKEFNGCLPKQCHRKELEDSGKQLLANISGRFTELIDKHKPYIEELNLDNESKRYEQLGLTEDNAYLHIRGHNLFDLLGYIGRLLCREQELHFKDDILKRGFKTENYWEILHIISDVKSLGL